MKTLFSEEAFLGVPRRSSRIRFRGPQGFILTDMAWVREVAERYGFSDLEIPSGSVVMEKHIKHCGGRCFYYPGRKWAIGLSYPRHLARGRQETEQTLAHELLHAYLWEHYGVTGHDANFKAMARARGIHRYCDAFDAVQREGPRQAPMSLTWSAG